MNFWLKIMIFWLKMELIAQNTGWNEWKNDKIYLLKHLLLIGGLDGGQNPVQFLFGQVVVGRLLPDFAVLPVVVGGQAQYALHVISSSRPAIWKPPDISDSSIDTKHL